MKPLALLIIVSIGFMVWLVSGLYLGLVQAALSALTH